MIRFDDAQDEGGRPLAFVEATIPAGRDRARVTAVLVGKASARVELAVVEETAGGGCALTGRFTTAPMGDVEPLNDEARRRLAPPPAGTT